jgi:nucleotide-binding universal stress UspA family protein
MFEKVLHPTDFSDVSKKALNFIKQLKEAGTKEVVVLHVIDKRNLDALAAYTTIASPNIEVELEESVRGEMYSIQDELEKAGLMVKTIIKKGIPFIEILNAEEEENVSVIVIGSHGKSNIAEMFLGSVSEKVIRKAKKPVLVVKR